MTDPVPSKEQIQPCLHGHTPGTCRACMSAEIERLREEDRRWENAHKILLSEIDRLKRPAHEREPPHCSSCACGLAPEPAADLAKWLRQEASFWRDDAFENAAKICERYEAHDAARDIRHMKGSSQPPGAGQ